MEDEFIVFDINEGYEITRLNLSELIYLLLLKQDDKLLEKIVFRDKQSEK